MFIVTYSIKGDLELWEDVMLEVLLCGYLVKRRSCCLGHETFYDTRGSHIVRRWLHFSALKCLDLDVACYSFRYVDINWSRIIKFVCHLKLFKSI